MMVRDAGVFDERNAVVIFWPPPKYVDSLKLCREQHNLYWKGHYKKWCCILISGMVGYVFLFIQSYGMLGNEREGLFGNCSSFFRKMTFWYRLSPKTNTYVTIQKRNK